MAFSRGDLGAIAYGSFVTLLLSCTMVVAGLKAGITPGVSPLVVLCGWGAFKKASRGPAGSRFLNLAQVAGSAGMAIVSGVIFSAPLLQVLHLNLAQSALQEQGVRKDLQQMPWKDAQALMAAHGLGIPSVHVPTNMLACVAGSLVGYGFVGLATRKFLSDPTLPAPEARACMSMINAATSAASQRPRLGASLVLSILSSFAIRVMAQLSLMVSEIVVWSKALGERTFMVDVPLDNGPLYIGIGGLLTLPTALLTFAGAFVRLIGDYLLAQVDSEGPLAEDFPTNSMRWVGGGAMTVGVVYSLMKFMGVRGKGAASTRGADSEDSLLDMSKVLRAFLLACVACGLAMLAVWLFVSDGFDAFSVAMILAILVMAMLMVPLGAILSLQIGSSSSPVSGTVFVTTLVLCGVALATRHASLEDVPTITTLLVAACVAVCAANDVSQDYKTLQLCGVAPREGFLSQIIGLLVGSVVVPVSLYISANAFGLGTERLPAPQGQMFATLVEGLLLERSLPWYPIIIGLGIGVLAVGVDVAGGRLGVQLPAMAFAVGIYLSPDTGTGILIGSLFRYAGEALRARRQQTPMDQTHECILASAGMITGSAFLDLVLGVAVLFGFDASSLSVFSSAGAAGKVPIPALVSNALALLAVVFLGWILYHNSVNGAVDPGEKCENSDQSDGSVNDTISDASVAPAREA